MVRVFKCHSFKSAAVVPVSDEPVAVCADGDMVFVATRQCTVKILKRNGDETGFSEWRCINTICTVEKIAYNAFQECIITLEQKRSWKSVSRFIRIYLHWQLEPDPQHRAGKQKTKVRMAGKAHTLHSSKEYVPQLEVVDLPLDASVTALDVCRSTGNFAIAFGREMRLYHIVEKTVANSDRTYKDVEPFLELYWNFEVISASLSEEYLVCCSTDQVQGVVIAYAEGDDGMASPRPASRLRSPLASGRWSRSSSRGEPTSPRSQRGSSQRMMFSLDDVAGESPTSDRNLPAAPRSPSPSVSITPSANMSTGTQSSVTIGLGPPRAIVDDEFYQEWSFEPDDAIANDSSGVTSRHASSIICLNNLHLGFLNPLHGGPPPVLRDFRGGPVKSSSGVSARTVLHLKDVSEQDDWLSVTMVPVYSPEQDVDSPVSWAGGSPVQSPFLQNRCAVSCYLSTSRGGYLYRLSPVVSLVSTYRYSNAAYKVAAGPHLLQVVTKTGLESYTARWGALAMPVTEGNEVRPPSSLDICMCGIEPFFGAVDLSHGRGIIALLTKIEAQKGQDDLQWNLYVLQNCSVGEFYKDMVTFAGRIQETGPSSYLHVVQEAHLLLRWELQRSPRPHPDLHDLFLESCALLADYYSGPRQDDWHLCLPYYRKSGLKVADVVRQAVQHRQHCKEQTSVYVYGQGLMQYLDWALFHSDLALGLKEDMSNTVLHIYAQTSPECLPRLLLLSRLEGYSPESAQQLLSGLSTLRESKGDQSSTLDRLAGVKMYLLLCDPNAAEMELSSLDRGELLDICSQYPDLIHSGVAEFTPLGQLMRRHSPDVLLQALADVVGQGRMTLDACLLLLEQNCEVSRCRNNQVREFLEVLLSDVKRKMWFEEASMLLCEIYVQRLLLGVEAPPPKHKRASLLKSVLPAGKGHFAVRFPWLDYLPPVTSPASLACPCQRVSMATPSGYGGQRVPTAGPTTGVRGGDRNDGACCCAFCLQDLLKLQSLLCSAHAGEALRGHVGRLTEGRDDLAGRDSLWMLVGHVTCWEAVARFSVQRYPHVVSRLAASTFHTDLSKWQVALRCLEERLRQETTNTSSHTDQPPSQSQLKDQLPSQSEPADQPSLQSQQPADQPFSLSQQPSDQPLSQPQQPTDLQLSQPQQQALLGAYTDVLREAVELFPADVFLSVLPPGGSLSFLLPLLTRCLQRRHRHHLTDAITAKGSTLLAQLHASS